MTSIFIQSPLNVKFTYTKIGIDPVHFLFLFCLNILSQLRWPENQLADRLCGFACHSDISD